MNKNDLRYQKTEDIIFKAFSDCVDLVGFEKTTVALICEKARISRNTFYSHYGDKYILLDRLFNGLQEKMSSSLTDKILIDMFKDNLRDAVAWEFNAVGENRNMLRLLIKCSKPRTAELLSATFIEKPLEQIIENYLKYKNDIELTLIKKYYSDAMVGYVETWLDNYDSFSREKIIDTMEKLCSTPLKTFYQVLFGERKAVLKPQYR